MTETTKQRLRYAWRGVEGLLALGLLAVLAELVLVLVNSPTASPDIRFIRREVQPETTLELAVNNTPEKMQAAPEIAVVVPKPKAQANAPATPVPQPAARRGVNNPPAGPATPPLLQFENLKRVFGFTPERNPAPAYADANTPKVVVINPILLSATTARRTRAAARTHHQLLTRRIPPPRRTT